MVKPTCKLDGCDRPRFSDGWCNPHWKRVRRTGSPGSAAINPYRQQGCQVPGCEGKHFGRGFCQTHLYRLRENGDPLVTRQAGPAPGPTHPQWRGNEIGYAGAHARVTRVRGRASAYGCSHCGGAALEWAYVHGSASEQIDPQSGFPFSPKVEDYMPLCTSCHRRYDAGSLLLDEWQGKPL